MQQSGAAKVTLPPSTVSVSGVSMAMPCLTSAPLTATCTGQWERRGIGGLPEGLPAAKFAASEAHLGTSREVRCEARDLPVLKSGQLQHPCSAQRGWQAFRSPV